MGRSSIALARARTVAAPIIEGPFSFMPNAMLTADGK
jgi:hypothetical protein